MSSIYDLSWSETSFLSKLKLFFKSRKKARPMIQSEYRQEQAEGCSALSSAYYSISGTAFSQLRVIFLQLRLIWLAPLRILLWGVTWLPLGAWCYWRMLPLSNEVAHLLGYEGMTADQCDVRQSILRRRGQYREARECIEEALAKGFMKPHTKALLHIGVADISLREGDRTKAMLGAISAMYEAESVEKYDLRQAVRIYRNCASLFDQIMPESPMHGADLRRKAESIAQSIRARDQILKIR